MFYFILFVHILITTRASPPSISVVIYFFIILITSLSSPDTWSHDRIPPFIIIYLVKGHVVVYRHLSVFVHHL